VKFSPKTEGANEFEKPAVELGSLILRQLGGQASFVHFART